MVPWPIAVLTLFYGVIAAASASMSWQVIIGVAQRPLAPQLLWLLVSSGAMLGLPLLRSWGRRLAIWTSVGLMVVMLSVAGILVLAAHKVGLGLLMAAGSGLHMLAIRYLNLPSVKMYFGLVGDGRGA